MDCIFCQIVAGKMPAVLMQNSGLGNSIDALTSLVLLYKFPVLLIISWRGYREKDFPEHSLMGRSRSLNVSSQNVPFVPSRSLNPPSASHRLACGSPRRQASQKAVLQQQMRS
jgi:sulfopyruvate decarboxylase TPP-binding subunit